jgi:GWxTD domain-containing protein
VRKIIRSATRVILISSFFLPFFLTLSCKTVGLVRALDKESQSFYSQVRYIISRKEEKIFLELSPADRGKFIEDFWKRRDPTPETEKNEFKEEYLGRVATANKFFRGGGKEGFLQDRGRVFILLGPPDEMYTEPVGMHAEAKSYEIWNYMTPYQIQLTFVDFSGDGEYTLITPSTWATQIINSAQTRLQNPGSYDEEPFDFSAGVIQEETIFLLIKIPYRNFWLKTREKNVSRYPLAVDLTVMDSSGKEVWHHQQEYDLAFHEEETDKSSPRDYSIRIPLDLEKGSYNAYLTLEDRLGERPQYKIWSFTIK